MTANDINTLTWLLLPFFIFIFFLIGYFLYKTSKQRLPSGYYKGNTRPFDIDLTKRLEKILSTNFQLIRLMPFIVLFAIDLFVIFILILGLGPQGFNDLLTPSSLLFKISMLLISLSSIGAWIAHLGTRQSIALREKTINLSKGKKLILKISEEGLLIPTIILVNPARWRAAEKNQVDIFIPYSDMIRVEVFSKAGSSPSQILITASGESAIWGEGAFEQIGPKFGIGIMREFFKDEENKILSFLQDRLGERLIIRDQLDPRI